MELVRNTPQLFQIFFIYVAVLQSLPPPRQSIVFGWASSSMSAACWFPRLTSSRTCCCWAA